MLDSIFDKIDLGCISMPGSEEPHWTIRDFGPLSIPKKGVCVQTVV